MRASDRKRRGLGHFLLWTLWFLAVGVAGSGWYLVERQIPKRLNVVVQEQEEFHFALPFDVTLLSESEEVVLSNQSNIPSGEIRLHVDEPFSLYAENEGSYRLNLKLFGRIQLKEIQVNVEQSRYAIPCGTPVGIYLKSRGVMVIGTGRIVQENGQETEPAFGMLESGDYIEAINGEPLWDKEALVTYLNHNGEQEAVLTVRRNGEVRQVRMSPVRTLDGSYKLGAWVRDDTQGIGTLTYLDANGNFGALGHGISDSDTGDVVEIEQGALYETEILGIDKGSSGSPGVMAGVIYYGPGTRVGTVEANTEQGIFGKADDRLRKNISGDPLEIGYRQDVKKGRAWLRSTVSGQVRDYEIEIQRVDYNPLQKSKSLVIRVVDPELLGLTGGIVQGMSGSPIIQGGKLVGAVTHVFVNDPTRGYGIFLETMLEEAGKR